ncbi:MAG: hypothetical protein H6550_16300 [Chitinophagales bacterium]|nr:hypothetical protein [Chitinophagales bacterium]
MTFAISENGNLIGGIAISNAVKSLKGLTGNNKVKEKIKLMLSEYYKTDILNTPILTAYTDYDGFIEFQLNGNNGTITVGIERLFMY